MQHEFKYHDLNITLQSDGSYVVENPIILSNYYTSNVPKPTFISVFKNHKSKYDISYVLGDWVINGCQTFNINNSDYVFEHFQVPIAYRKQLREASKLPVFGNQENVEAIDDVQVYDRLLILNFDCEYNALYVRTFAIKFMHLFNTKQFEKLKAGIDKLTPKERFDVSGRCAPEFQKYILENTETSSVITQKDVDHYGKNFFSMSPTEMQFFARNIHGKFNYSNCTSSSLILFAEHTFSNDVKIDVTNELVSRKNVNQYLRLCCQCRNIEALKTGTYTAKEVVMINEIDSTILPELISHTTSQE